MAREQNCEEDADENHEGCEASPELKEEKKNFNESFSCLRKFLH
jgi:hypothetical protein